MTGFRTSVRTTTLAVAMAMALGSAAQAQEPNGYPITNVNLRAGPGTEYPVILTVPADAPITILGCLPDYTWCDSVFQDYRGWMRSIYLSGYSDGSYYLLRDYAPDLGYRPVTFNINAYWDSYYRDQPFYGERTRWAEPRGQGWVDDAVFYDRLSPYGSWTWIQGQYVWVPHRVDRGWRPYTRGRWVYTDRGWTWVSNEPYGWATYHYGRWGFSDRIGWFWVPGNRWAPAWVSWRQSDDYLAWAPLPPEPDRGGITINISFGDVPDYYWSVVPARDFLADDLPRYYVRDRDRRPLIDRARPVGHTTIINNNVTVNNVVNVKYVEQKTKKKVVQRKIARTAKADQAGKIEGNTVEVYEPEAEETGKALAPPQPKTVEEVAATSETKSQAEGAATTEDLLAPPEVKEAVKKRKGKKKEGGAETSAGLAPELPKGEEKDTPPEKKASQEEPVSAEEIKTPAAGAAKPADETPKERPAEVENEEKETKPDTSPAAKSDDMPAPKPKADEGAPAGAPEKADAPEPKEKAVEPKEKAAEPKPKAKDDKAGAAKQKAKGKDDGKAKAPKAPSVPPAETAAEPKQAPPQDAEAPAGTPDDAGGPTPDETGPAAAPPEQGAPPEPKPEPEEAPPPKADDSAPQSQGEGPPAKPKQEMKAPDKAKGPPTEVKPKADKPKPPADDKAKGKAGAAQNNNTSGTRPAANAPAAAKPKASGPPKPNGNGPQGATGPQGQGAAGAPPKKKQADDKKKKPGEGPG